MQSLIASFLLERQANGCTPQTLQWHRDSLSLFVAWLESQDCPNDPNAWTPTLLRQYVVHVQGRMRKDGKPLAGSTVTSYVQSVLAFVRWLVAEELIDRDITKNVRKPPPPHVEKQPLTDDELRSLLVAAKASTHPLRDYAILCLLIDTGLRAAELTSLTLACVSFEQQLILVRNGKGRKDRAVPFSLTTGKAVRAYLHKERSPERQTDLLFITDDGQALAIRSLHSLIRRLACVAGVDRAHPHLFRHTFAVHFLRNGGDSLMLQRLLGHSSLTMTNHYVTMQTGDLVQGHLTASPLTSLTKTRR